MENQLPMKKEIMPLLLIELFRALNLIPTDMSVENLKFKLMIMVKKQLSILKKLVLSGKELKLYKCSNQYFLPSVEKISGFADPRNTTFKSLTRYWSYQSTVF
jgi:hypothetical protein